MDFTLPKDLQMIQKEIRNFAKKQIEPYADEWMPTIICPLKKPCGRWDGTWDVSAP